MAARDGDDKTLDAIANVIAVMDEYVSPSPGVSTVVGGFDYLELAQRLNQLRSDPLGPLAIRRAEAQAPTVRPVLAGLKKLVPDRDCDVEAEELPDTISELLEPSGPPEVDRVIQYLLRELA